MLVNRIIEVIHIKVVSLYYRVTHIASVNLPSRETHAPPVSFVRLETQWKIVLIKLKVVMNDPIVVLAVSIGDC